jgi:hypothetical protein
MEQDSFMADDQDVCVAIKYYPDARLFVRRKESRLPASSELVGNIGAFLINSDQSGV